MQFTGLQDAGGLQDSGSLVLPHASASPPPAVPASLPDTASLGGLAASTASGTAPVSRASISAESTAAAPQPSVAAAFATAVTCGGGPVPPERLVALVGLIARHVSVGEHTCGLVRYVQTVTAADVLAYLRTSGLAGSVEEAVACGNQLILAGLMTHAKDPRQPFKDKATSALQPVPTPRHGVCAALT